MKTRAVRITAPGGPENLVIGETELPPLGPYEVKVAVAAAGLNRADCLQRRGVYPAPPGVDPDVPGLEFAGSVVECGARVGSLSVGDRVMGIVAGGGMAEHVVVHARECVRIPDSFSYEDAAAIPEVFFTSYDALVLQGDLRPGQNVLIHAAGSGIGTAAIQIVRAYQATAIGTSRSADKLTRCKEYGMSHGVDTADGTFAAALKELGGADLVLDTIGAKYLSENVRSLRVKGRIVVIGLLGGVQAELSLGALLGKRGTIMGSVLRSRPIEEKIALARSFEAHLLPLFESGVLRPVVDEVMPMASVADAHRRMEAGETFGKLVLTW